MSLLLLLLLLLLGLPLLLLAVFVSGVATLSVVPLPLWLLSAVFVVDAAALSFFPLPLLSLLLLVGVGVTPDAGTAALSPFPLLPLAVLVGGVVLDSGAASASGSCGFLPSFGGDATLAGFCVPSGFFPAGGDFGLGFPSFSSVTAFGLLGRFGLSLSVIGLPTFLAAFVVVVLVLACLTGMDSLFRLSVFLGGDLLVTFVQFLSSSVVAHSVSANFPSRFVGAVELVFLTAPE